MPLYDKSVGSLIKDMVATSGMQEPFSRNQIYTWFQEYYPKVTTGLISAWLVRLSTNEPSRLGHAVKPGEDDIFFKVDNNRFRRYDRAADPSPLYKNPHQELPPSSDTDEESSDTVSEGEFAYERDLQNFLARNLTLLEPDLRLYQENGVTGLEFPVGGRFIDILARDRSNNFVIVELKVSKGYDRVVGQLLRYMAWVKKHHAKPTEKVRGVIVAREITEDLVLACSSVDNVQLYEYQLSVSLQKVDEQ